MRVFLALDLLMLPLVALAALEALSFPAKRNEERVRLGQSMGSEKTIRLRRTRSCGREVRRESRRVRESEGGRLDSTLPGARGESTGAWPGCPPSPCPLPSASLLEPIRAELLRVAGGVPPWSPSALSERTRHRAKVTHPLVPWCSLRSAFDLVAPSLSLFFFSPLEAAAAIDTRLTTHSN